MGRIIGVPETLDYRTPSPPSPQRYTLGEVLLNVVIGLSGWVGACMVGVSIGAWKDGPRSVRGKLILAVLFVVGTLLIAAAVVLKKRAAENRRRRLADYARTKYLA